MKRALSMLLMLGLMAAPAAMAEDMPLTMLAINVGKADAILLMSGGTRYLVDTGTAESYGAVSAALRVRGIDHLDGVIITHTHKDHAGGAAALAASGIGVDAWYAPRWYEGKEKKHPAVLAAAARGKNVTWLQGGDELPLDGGTLTVLGPVTEGGDENDNSLVLRAETPDGSILLTGDMEFPEEDTLMIRGLLGPSTVLKVANHANPDACSDRLISLVQPKAAVISTDSAAEPDTPSLRIVRALKQIGAGVYLTQDTKTGVLVTLRGGEAEVQAAADELPEAVSGVYFSDKSVAQDMIEVRNGGEEAADLSGWYICSERGKEVFVFPEGAVLAAGRAFTVGSLASEDAGDFLWREDRVWHKSKDDKASLYDAYGRLIDELE